MSIKLDVHMDQNGNKGEVMMENRAYLKENGYLFTTADILGALAKADGFKSRGSKNFAAVNNAILNGANILNVLGNPVKYGVAKNQVRYFESFVKAHKLAKRVYAPTRKGVLVPVADINRMEERDGKVFSTIDYTEINSDSYKEISESFLSESFAGRAETIEFTRNGKLIKQRVMFPMKNLFFVDLYLDLPEEEKDYSDEDKEAIQLREKLMKDGFYFIDEHGEEGHAYFLLRTPSQARVLQAIFIDTSFMHPIQALKMMGNELIAYGSVDADGNYVVKVDKMLTRPGLAGTNSIPINSIQIGNEIERIGNDIRLLGGNVTMRVTEDRQVEIKTGKYRMWNAKEQKFEEFDAAEHPLTLTAADGAVFANERVGEMIEAYTGKFVDAAQIRITPFSKGLMIIVPHLNSYYPDDDIVALQSAVKGDYELLMKANPEFKPQFRIAIFNKKLNEVKTYTDMPYQFVQASSLNVNDLWNALSKHLEEVGNALHDPTIMKKYVGLDKVINSELFEDEVEHYMLDQSRVSTFTTFLDMYPWTFDDVQMKKYALDILKERIDGWKKGNIPVEGHYRYMIQDPYAVLEAGTKYEVRNDKGELMIINRGDYHIQPNEAYVPSAIKEKSNLYIAAGRNPMITKGEWQVLRNRGLDHYLRATRRGYFSNLLVMSVHDMATFAMGGASL